MIPTKLYFVTRADLRKGQAAAQCIHAMNEWADEHGVSPPNEHVVVYKVKDAHTLCMLYRELREKGVETAAFFEPDFDDEITAIATRGGPLKLKLL
jgi:peptidyl-tRNA hydrolase